jgi:hypothetical protein
MDNFLKKTTSDRTDNEEAPLYKTGQAERRHLQQATYGDTRYDCVFAFHFRCMQSPASLQGILPFFCRPTILATRFSPHSDRIGYSNSGILRNTKTGDGSIDAQTILIYRLHLKTGREFGS